ncbi:hypothetical protein [Micromonospora sp. KLBMP9576]|uniref:hypothetical protein n=1 Tax=Micromonospora sp. KLBMP9576 TaxID=3424769 RepID=UPI003D8A8317
MGPGGAPGSPGGSERVLVGSAEVGSPVGVAVALTLALGLGVGCGLGEGSGDGRGDGSGVGRGVGDGRGVGLTGGGGTGPPRLGGGGGFGCVTVPGSGGVRGAATLHQSPGVTTAGDGFDPTTGGRSVAGAGITTGPTEGVGRNGVPLSGRAVLPTVAEPVLIAASSGIDAVPASNATVNR